MPSPQENPPDVPQMLSTHTLGISTIKRHNTDAAIFDKANLAMLKDFCTDPAQKDILLVRYDMVDQPGDAPGTRANKIKGNLAGYVIAKHENAEPALLEEEIAELREWFKRGGDV